ncbi:MAG: hypothetical protein NC452_00085 [Eubacterium sp.]|nr:hypothetical protein [Eubacterium sp.]
MINTGIPKGDSPQCGEMSARLTKGRGDRWENIPLAEGIREAEPPLNNHGKCKN